MSETVARRIVMPRELWDRLVRLADERERSQGGSGPAVSPTDLAGVAVERGLAALEDEGVRCGRYIARGTGGECVLPMGHAGACRWRVRT